MHKGAQQFPAALVSAPLQHWQVPARKRMDPGRAAREQVLASLEPAARSCWHHLSFTYAPPSERGAWYIFVAFQLLAEVSQSWGVDPDSSWTTQWSSTRGMERDRGNSQYSIMQTVGNSKTIFLFVCSRFHFFNKDKRRDRSWEGKEVNCFDLTSVIRLMKCQSIQVRT